MMLTFLRNWKMTRTVRSQKRQPPSQKTLRRMEKRKRRMMKALKRRMRLREPVARKSLR